MTTQTTSPLDEQPYFSAIKKGIENGMTNADIVRLLEYGIEHDGSTFTVSTSKDSIKRFRERHRFLPPPASTNKAMAKVEGDKAEVRSAAHIGPHQEEWRYLDDPDKMLEERGLDPTEWAIDSATVNEWDGPSQEGPVTYHQAKLHLKRKVSTTIFAARSDGWVAPKPRLNTTKGPKLVAVVGDQQVPFHDENLHELFCAWAADNQPDEIVSLGDTVDYPDISRHRLDPENTAKVNECNDVGYSVLRGYREAAPNARIRKLMGNHDERIRNLLLDKGSTQPLYAVRQASTDEEEGELALSLKFLLRLDELHIELVDPKGPYDLAQINLSNHLAVRHGWIAQKGSGKSALETLDHLGYSVIVGHTHRQSIVYQTTHDIDGSTTTLTAAEAGCMCRVSQREINGRKWPDYTVHPDWQQGFTTVTVHPDGQFRIENATYVNDTLLWRDQQYR